MAATEIKVYVQALPGHADFGDTTITLPETHPLREEYLMNSRQFFIDRGRPEDAQKFYDAVAQTPSD